MYREKSHMTFQFFHLFGPFEAIAAWNYNKNFHQDWGKNSLDVIGHTHTSGLCLSPIRHSGGVCGPSCGASQSVCTVLLFFLSSFTTSKCAPSMANHISRRATTLPQACQAHLFTLRRRADTWGNQKVGFHSVELLNCATLPGEEEIWEKVTFFLS